MKIEQLQTAIMELGPEDAAKALVEAICAVGNHGREAGELIPGLVNALDEDSKANFSEGCGWLED